MILARSQGLMANLRHLGFAQINPLLSPQLGPLLTMDQKIPLMRRLWLA